MIRYGISLLNCHTSDKHNQVDIDSACFDAIGVEVNSDYGVSVAAYWVCKVGGELGGMAAALNTVEEVLVGELVVVGVVAAWVAVVAVASVDVIIVELVVFLVVLDLLLGYQRLPSLGRRAQRPLSRAQ